jgi:nucleotide-binding universal stress UspA family protein
MMRPRRAREEGHRRKFLVIIDDTPECLVALSFAARRAAHTGGGLALLSVIEPEAPQSFLGVEDIIRAEAHIEADEDIAVLVLAAGHGPEGPGPLVTAIAARGSGDFPVPITIVPGTLSEEQLDALA